MSIKVMTRVWEHAEYKESTLLILLALADFADDNGLCWPEVPTLASKARVSDRRAIDIIQALEKDGAIVYRRGGGRGKRSLYGVLVGLTDEQKEKVKLFHRNYFSENKTVKPGAIKGELQRKERVNYSVNSRKDLEQQDAPNPDPIRHDPSENRQREGKAPPAPAIYQHPAVEIYSNLTGRTPNRASADMIAAQVKDTAKWEREIARWLASDFKPGNIVGMLDWYHGKGRHQDNNGARPPADLPMITAATNSSKRIPTADERRKIIEASNAKARGE